MNPYKEFGIYRITNTINGKTYVGKTGVSFGDRWDCHKAQLNAGTHSNPCLQRDWDEHGKEAFEFAILKAVSDKEQLDILEKEYIRQYRELKNVITLKMEDTTDF